MHWKKSWKSILSNWEHNFPILTKNANFEKNTDFFSKMSHDFSVAWSLASVARVNMPFMC